MKIKYVLFVCACWPDYKNYLIVLQFLNFGKIRGKELHTLTHINKCIYLKKYRDTIHF